MLLSTLLVLGPWEGGVSCKTCCELPAPDLGNLINDSANLVKVLSRILGDRLSEVASKSSGELHYDRSENSGGEKMHTHWLVIKFCPAKSFLTQSPTVQLFRDPWAGESKNFVVRITVTTFQHRESTILDLHGGLKK